MIFKLCLKVCTLTNLSMEDSIALVRTYYYFRLHFSSITDIFFSIITLIFFCIFIMEKFNHFYPHTVSLVRLESPSLKLFGIISVISAGVLLSGMFSPDICDAFMPFFFFFMFTKYPSTCLSFNFPNQTVDLYSFSSCKGDRIWVLGFRFCHARCCHVWFPLVYDPSSFAGMLFKSVSNYGFFLF